MCYSIQIQTFHQLNTPRFYLAFHICVQIFNATFLGVKFQNLNKTTDDFPGAPQPAQVTTARFLAVALTQLQFLISPQMVMIQLELRVLPLDSRAEELSIDALSIYLILPKFLLPFLKIYFFYIPYIPFHYDFTIINLFIFSYTVAIRPFFVPGYALMHAPCTSAAKRAIQPSVYCSSTCQQNGYSCV